MNKKETSHFWNAVKYTSLLIFCVALVFFGIARAYEEIKLSGYGETVKALEYKNGVIIFFGYKIPVI